MVLGGVSGAKNTELPGSETIPGSVQGTPSLLTASTRPEGLLAPPTDGSDHSWVSVLVQALLSNSQLTSIVSPSEGQARSAADNRVPAWMHCGMWVG